MGSNSELIYLLNLAALSVSYGLQDTLVGGPGVSNKDRGRNGEQGDPDVQDIFSVAITTEKEQGQEGKPYKP